MKEHIYYEIDGVDIGCIYDHDTSKLTVVLPLAEIVVDDVPYGTIETVAKNLGMKEGL